MSYLYQINDRYFVQVAESLKELAVAELTELGATDIQPVFRGLHLTTDRESLYRINYCSRLVTRVLAPLAGFACHSDKYLYQQAREVNWHDFLQADQTFAIFAQVSHSKIKHSKFAALRLKDAIADHFRERDGKRPSVDRETPDVWINLHIERNNATISLDTSGGSLHRRGYRLASVDAPMQETVAAAIIQMSGWDGEQPLMDPMCGSGTLLCEALMQYGQIPAAYLQDSFGFERLPDFKSAVWEGVKLDASAAMREIPSGLLFGSDQEEKAIAAAGANLSRLPGGENVALETKDLFDYDSLSDRCLIFNPPYGIRLNDRNNLSGFYREIGDFLKQRCTESTAFIYFGERGYLKKIGLRPSWKQPLKNAQLDGRLAKFEMY